MDLFQGNGKVLPGQKRQYKSSDYEDIVKAWWEWEKARRNLYMRTQELEIEDCNAVQVMAKATATHESIEAEQRMIKAQMTALRQQLWLAVAKADPAFDPAMDWALVREESDDKTLTIIRTVDEDTMMKKALYKMFEAEQKEDSRKVGFGK